MILIPTALLCALEMLAWRRARSVLALWPAARALTALLGLDMVRQCLAPTATAWRAGEALSAAGVWLVRLDGVLVAGVWPGVVAALLLGWSPPLLGLFYGVAAVAAARVWPAAWLGLLLAPRFAVGALAWWVAAKSEAHAPQTPPTRTPEARGMGSMPRLARGAAGASHWPGQHNPSLRLGLVIAAFEVGGALFLWLRWGYVQALSCLCWLACAWMVWRTRR